MKGALHLLAVALLMTQAAWAATRYVSPGGNHQPPFTSWAAASTNIESALAAALSGDTVLVANGTYYPSRTLSPSNDTITIRSVNGYTQTRVNGRGLLQVFNLGRNCTLDGFTVTNGYSDGLNIGAGVQANNSVVRNCLITGNRAMIGGGLAVMSSGLAENCIIRGNTASNAAGGVLISNAGIVRNCTISDNAVIDSGAFSSFFIGGGGAVLFQSGQLENCDITGNVSSNYGGGVYIYGFGDIERCSVYGNMSQLGGGGVLCDNGGFVHSSLVRNNSAPDGGGVLIITNGVIQNSTVARNTAVTGGGVYCRGGGTNSNAIIYFNTATNSSNIHRPGGFGKVNYTCTYPVTAGTGNITNNPQFLSGSDYHLPGGSPCVDTGLNLPGIYQRLDRDGKPRVANGTVDRGAYEIGPPAPFLAITNAVRVVAYEKTTATIGGTNNSYVSGHITVSNTLNGYSASIPAALSWVKTAIPLALGTNTIYAYGTNVDHYTVSDMTTVVRKRVGTGTPYVNVTNQNAYVIYDVNYFVVAGTIGVHVVGNLWVTNATTQTSFSFQETNGWFSVLVALDVGMNQITVYGTNVYGLKAFDTLQVERGGGGTGTPDLAITSQVSYVTYDGKSLRIAGTNNPHIVGGMWASNTATKAVVRFGAGQHWRTPLIALNVGGNTIRICGTNAFGVVVDKAISITRGGVGTGLPHLAITNTLLETLVENTVTEFTVRGTNNLHITGTMWAYNPRNSRKYTFFARQAWETVPAVQIEVGNNDIRISGTNKFGQLAQDIVVVTRTGTGTGTPYIDVTTTPTVVTYDVAEFSVAGVNNENVIGSMIARNAANSQSRGFFARPNWVSPPVPLAVGPNMIVVSGTNVYGSSTNDSVIITRLAPGTGTPGIDITTTPVTVSHDVTTYRIAGVNNQNVVGRMLLTNAANAAAASIVAQSKWVSPQIALAVGQNIITVSGTNLFGDRGSDSVTLVRGKAGTGTPFTDIVTTSQFVTLDKLLITLHGTNNGNVVGTMWLTNSVNMLVMTFPASLVWNILNVPLEIGINTLTVIGTNASGQMATDSITVTRGEPGTGTPVLKILTEPTYVTYDIDSYSVGGINNRNVIGGMWVINALNGYTTNLPAALAWQFRDIALAVGDNLITVYGTNLFDVVTNDTVVISRGGPGTGSPDLQITVPGPAGDEVVYTVAEYALEGIINENVVGQMWVSNAANHAVLSFAAALNWTAPPLPLDPYANELYVSGTNIYGIMRSDHRTITRVPPSGVTNFVTRSGGHVWPYTTWGTAATNLLSGASAAMPGNTVLVNTGVYVVARQVPVKAGILFTSVSGYKHTTVRMRADRSDRCFYVTDGVLDGFTISNEPRTIVTISVTNDVTTTNIYTEIKGGGVHLKDGTVRNCLLTGNSPDFRVVTNITVAGQTATTNLSVESYGGAVYINRGGLVTNCIISDNFSSWHGGGIYANNGGTIADCLISGNVSTNGGGVYLLFGGEVVDCIVQDNTAHSDGGGVFILGDGMVLNSDLTRNRANSGSAVYCYSGGYVSHCKMTQNSAYYHGTVYCFYDGVVENSEISGNEADYAGGIFCENGGEVYNCTIVSNTAITSAGGVYCNNGGYLVNTIIYGNMTGYGGFTNYGGNGGSVLYEYCCTYPEISGAANGAGNITNMPQILSLNPINVHLLESSPCVNAGTNLSWMIGTTDLDGVPRIHDGRINMGCYEQTRSSLISAPALTLPMAIASGQHAPHYVTVTGQFASAASGTKQAGQWTVVKDPFRGWHTNGIQQTLNGQSWSTLLTGYVDEQDIKHVFEFLGADSNYTHLSSEATVMDVIYVGPPMVTIVTPPATTTFDEVSYVVRGTRNYDVVGTMRVTNPANGFQAAMTARDNWLTPPVNLSVGANVITVSGTNVLGDTANDTVTIVRGEPGTGIPFVDATSSVTFVTYDTVAMGMSGTNNMNVIGNMQVVNMANGDTAAFPAAPDWTSPPVNLDVGINVLYAIGSNLFGVITNSVHVVERGIAGTGVPAIDLTTAVSYVTFDVQSILLAGTNNDNVVGDMAITNMANGLSAKMAATRAWQSPQLLLAVGLNSFQVTGTNLYGDTATDTIDITRGIPGTGVPDITVTSIPTWVTYDITQYTIAGTNNVNVVGEMQIVNSADGHTVTAAADDSWSFATLPLQVGTNRFTVNGTNLFGASASDNVRIIRGRRGTGVPQVIITNQVLNVPHTQPAFSFAGTINPNVVGGMWLEVTQDGQSASFTAQDEWLSAPVGLSNYMATVSVTVYGTNMFGAVASDSVDLTRDYPDGVTNYVVSVNGRHIWPYLTWANAATNIQDAIDAVTDGTTTLAADGVYRLTEPISITRDIIFKSINGPERAILTPIVKKSHRGVYMTQGVLSGFTVSNGYHHQEGGGVLMDNGGTIDNCLFIGNFAPDGGAVHIKNSGLVLNSIFTRNEAIEAAALWLNSGGIARNCLIYNNFANEGGSVRLHRGGTLDNCSVVTNQGIANSGITCYQGGLIQNCILYDNIITNYANIGTGMLYVNSCVYPALPSAVDGGGNITNAPIFTFGSHPFQLQVNSPCRDGGINLPWMIDATDQAGNPRIVNDMVDIGAYEFVKAELGRLLLCKIKRRVVSLVYNIDDSSFGEELFTKAYTHNVQLQAGRSFIADDHSHFSDPAVNWNLKPGRAEQLDYKLDSIPIKGAIHTFEQDGHRVFMKYREQNNILKIKIKTVKKSGIDYQTLIGRPNEETILIFILDNYIRENKIKLDKGGKYKP